MPCFYPIKAWQTRKGEKLVFEQPHQPARQLQVPCNYCLGCLIQQSIHWQVRIQHEASFYDHNQFVTWTYNNKNLPTDGALRFADHRQVIKKIRKDRAPQTFRYFGVGEYGGKDQRPHFHTILFGLELDDLVLHTRNQHGQNIYTSDYIDRMWGKGHCYIGAVEKSSARYVASHAEKSLKALKSIWTRDQHGVYIRKKYLGLDSSGRTVELPHPATRQSNRPGIGARWVDTYWPSLRHGNIVMLEGSGKKRTARTYQIPPYYIRRLKETHPEVADQIQEAAAAFIESEQNRWNSSEERLTVREIVLQKKLDQKGRASHLHPDQGDQVKRIYTREELDHQDEITEAQRKAAQQLYKFMGITP